MQPTVRMDEGLENYTASVHSEAIQRPFRDDSCIASSKKQWKSSERSVKAE